MDHSLQKPKKQLPRRTWALIALVGVALLIVVLSLQLWNARQEINEPSNNPEQATEKISEDTVSKVDKLIVLPAGETPRVAKVSELGKLPSSPLFSNVQQDDVVLIYDKAKKVVIYRPAENKIVEVATYTSDSPTDN